MIRKLALLSTLLCLLCNSVAQQAPSETLDPADYKILSTVVSELLVHQYSKSKKHLEQIVIGAETSTGIPPGAAGMTSMSDEEAKKIRKEEQDLVKTLVESGKLHAPLDASKITAGTKCVMVSQGTLDGIFGKGGGWEEFYKQFPGSQGVTFLSRVTYNSDKTKALVYVGTMNSMLGGQGELVLLVKQGPDWKITHHGMVWVS